MIIILGPTASGKTRLAAQLAHRVDGEIISADSRQVYRDMTIGTGKDLQEYCVEGKTIPYHLIDIREAGDKYHVHQFREDVSALYPKIVARGRVPILCGGSGMYIHALLQGHAFTGVPVNPELRAELEILTHKELVDQFSTLPSSYETLADLSTKKRTIRAVEIARYLQTHPDYPSKLVVPEDFKIYGINPELQTRRDRISTRLHDRLQTGLIEEVQALLHRRISPENLIYYGLEYKFVTQYLTGTLPYDQMIRRLETEIHRFAKRQMTFFRKMERDGLVIHWLDNRASGQVWLETILNEMNTTTPPND